MKETVEARNALENRAYTLRNLINDEDNLGGVVSDEEKETMEDAINVAIEWLEENFMAEKEDYDEQYKELDSIVTPIIEKLYARKAEDGTGEEEGEGGGGCLRAGPAISLLQPARLHSVQLSINPRVECSQRNVLSQPAGQLLRGAARQPDPHPQSRSSQ